MPELPEAETIARDLHDALQGAVVRAVRTLRPDVLRHISARRLAGRLGGVTIHRVSRRAKSIVFDLGEAGGLVVTPRFTGALLLDGAPDDDYTCLFVDLTDGRSLRYRDVRRLGTVALLDPTGLAAWSDGLGPEPLDPELTAERFSGIVRGSRRPVKSILMDQRRLAGVGNIYANEVCWRASIRPMSRGSTLSRTRCSELLVHLRALLTESIALRGTTFRDFRDAYGQRGAFAARLQAYGRDGQLCARCGNTLRATHALEGRQTVWCPNRECQR